MRQKDAVAGGELFLSSLGIWVSETRSYYLVRIHKSPASTSSVLEIQACTITSDFLTVLKPKDSELFTAGSST